jgi:hypothetical protein
MRTAREDQRTTDRHHLHWETVLDRLELDVMLSERQLLDPDAPGPEPWSDPHLPGPVPADLLDRARRLVTRQQQVRDKLAVAALSLRRHETLTARVDRAVARPARSAYLDVDA